MSAHKLHVETRRHMLCKRQYSVTPASTRRYLLCAGGRTALLDCPRYAAARGSVNIDVINALIRDPRKAFNGAGIRKQCSRWDGS